MADVYVAGLRATDQMLHGNWMDRQDREERAREINRQRTTERVSQDFARNVRPPSAPVAGLQRPADMPAAIPAPAAAQLASAAPAAAAPSSETSKTSRQGYEATPQTASRRTNRAENMPLPPAIPLEQMTPAQRDAYARYAEHAVRSGQAPGAPGSEGRRPIEQFFGGTSNGRNVNFNTALRLGAVSTENTDIGNSPYDTPNIPVSQMNSTQRAAYAAYINLVNRGANPQAIALARADAEAAGVFAKADRQGYAAVAASSPQTPQSRSAPTQETAQLTSFTPQGGTLDTRNPQDLQRIAQAIGVQPGSGYRSPQEQAGLVAQGVGASSTSLHPHGRAIDFPMSSFPQGWTIEQAGQYVQQQWQRAGFPQAEFIAQANHGTGPHVHVEWGGAGAQAPASGSLQSPGATPQPAAPVIFQAVSSSPEGLPFTVQQAQEVYDQNRIMFEAAQRAGRGDLMLEPLNNMRQANVQAMSALGYQAALDMLQTGNPARFQQYYGVMTGGGMIEFQPFQDGTFSYSVNGIEQGRGTREQIAGEIMELVNTEYLQNQQEAANERNQAQFESSLRMREDAFSQQLEGQRDITLEAFRAQLEQQRIDPASVETFEINGEGGRAIRYQRPDGQIVVREIRQTEARSPATNGRGGTTTVTSLGPEMVMGGQ